MLVLIVLGAVLTKLKVITHNGTKEIASILLNIVTPALLIKAYQIDFDIKVLKDILTGFGLSVLIHIIYIVISKFMFFAIKDDYKRKVLKFTNIYSNAGFMGIPLVAATLGDSGVLIASTYLASFNVIVWTHGLLLYSEDKKLLSIKSLLKNPGIIGVTLALVLFFLQIRLTGVFEQCVGYVADLNTPLAMILVGTYLANSNLKHALCDISMYIISFTRLILLPVIIVVLFYVLGVEENVFMPLILPAACPCAAMAAIYAHKFKFDPGYPSQIVSFTTVVSMVTLPLIAYLSSLFV
jgi:predicted permease